MRYLLILFIAMPIIEIGVLIRVGGWLGLWTTLAIVILTAVAGTWMLRQQSTSTLMQAQQRLQAGQLPAEQIFEGLLLLVGGVLLLTPGFVTDAVGFACLIPWSRRWLAGQISKRASGGAMTWTTYGPNQGARPAEPRPQRTNSDDIVDGDFREID